MTLKINPFSLAKRINRPLILDGAMGSLLQQNGVPAEGKMWMSYANVSYSEKVLNIHKSYINAGADIITTNTFRTNPLAIQNFSDLNIKDVVKKSVNIAKEAVGNLPVFIAGSNAPAEDCYLIERKISEKELELNHKKHIDLLMENGCDFILNETHSHLDEIKIISDYCSKNEIPFVMSLFSFDGEKLMSGENIIDVVKFLIDTNPLSLSFNCILPEKFTKIYNSLDSELNWGTYLNCGSGDFSDENITCGISPVEYSKFIKIILEKSPSFIGSCCGSSPDHIKEIRKLLDARNY
jgi:methionine synthase I (cobalamin-dependent)